MNEEESYDELEKEYDGLGEDFTQLLDKYKTLKEENSDLKYENMQLKTENNDMTAAVNKTLKILYEEYHYGTLPMEHYDKIYNSLKDADL